MSLSDADRQTAKTLADAAPLPTSVQRDRLAQLLGIRTPSGPPVPWRTSPAPAPDRPHAGHLYVVEFESGVIKVGRERTPGSRIAQHRRDAPVRRVWESPEVDPVDTAEDALIARATQVGHRLRPSREYFAGMSFEDVVAIAIDQCRLLSSPHPLAAERTPPHTASTTAGTAPSGT